MLDVIGRDGRSGRVIVRDERADGSVILLVCDEFQDAGAVFARPMKPAEPLPKPGFPWPGAVAEQKWTIDALAAFPSLSQEPFEFTIETTNMPAGPLMFRLQPFLRRLFQGIGNGENGISLTLGDASDWGWNGEMPEDVGRALT